MTTGAIGKTMRIATTYAGTIMGAGFASGQELTQFFVVYGNMGLVGLLVTGCLFSWLGIQILELSYTIRATSYHELLYYICGKKIGSFLDLIITLFLFGVLTIMLAGAGTLCQDHLNLPYILGPIIMACCLALTTLYGLQGITTANLIITPLLTITVLIISLYSLSHHQINLSLIHSAPQLSDLPAPHWLLGSLLYLSYNLVMTTTVLAPLGGCIAQRSVRIGGSIAGGLLLMLLAGLITLVVMIHYPQSLDYDIPMLYIASSQHIIHQTSFIFIFITAIYTTGLASLYGCTTKFTATTGISTKYSLLILIILSLFCSQVGFADLIGMVFPLFGYATLWFTCKLLYLSFCTK